MITLKRDSGSVSFGVIMVGISLLFMYTPMISDIFFMVNIKTDGKINMVIYSIWLFGLFVILLTPFIFIDFRSISSRISDIRSEIDIVSDDITYRESMVKKDKLELGDIAEVLKNEHIPRQAT